MTVKITVEKVSHSTINEVDFSNIVFGKTFADHMLKAEYYDGAWQEVKIMPYQPITMSPATTALHYGQAIFEGMKAFKDKEGNALLFRPRDNWIRFNKSAERMCMPAVPEDLFMEGIRKLVELDSDWIPTTDGSSLYIRPFMFSSDEFLGIRPSDHYTFIIFCCPVGAYYPEPIKVKFELQYSRACEGGTGNVKTAGNYGASLYPAYLGQKEGYKQLIWTDSNEHKYIEESGTMNIFFVVGDTIITPETDGTILEGVTRSCVITLLKGEGYKVEERKVTVDEILEAFSRGELKEAFGTGTAATIAHITAIGHKEDEMELPPVLERKISNWLLESIEGIRRGELGDKYNWVKKVTERVKV